MSRYKVNLCTPSLRYDLLLPLIITNDFIKDDDKCTDAFGTCKWTDEDPCNNGEYFRGKCAGPNNRRCCIRKGKLFLVEKNVTFLVVFANIFIQLGTSCVYFTPRFT